MAKLTLSDLMTLANQASAIATINANNAAIETALENTLSRDGTSPNTMGASLDMNSHHILNLPPPGDPTSPVRLQDITGDEVFEVELTADYILEQLLTVDGAGSGLDADTLDGIQASAFLTEAEAAAAYQPLDSDLTTIAGLAKADGNIIVGDGATWVVESGATARTSLGLGTGDSPTFTNVTVSDEAYDATGWNDDLTVPTKNAVRDAIESLAVSPGGYIPFEYEDTSFDIDSTHSFYFGTYESLAGVKLQITNTEDQSDFDGGGFRDVLAIFHYDDDTTDYEALSDQKVSYGIRSYVTPSTAGRLLTDPQYKDYTAGTFEAIGYIMWPDRGCSGVTASAIQYGEGIASNEFAASNPSDAPSQSFSMAAVQAIVSSKKAASDSSHKARGVLVSNIGKSITAAFDTISGGTDGDDGQFEYLLRGDLATVNTGAIIMPSSASGNVGTRIVYDTGDFTEFDRAANTFVWAMGGSGELGLSIGALYPIVSDGLALGGTGSLWSDLWLASGGVINFNEGDVTITHAANTLAFAGGTTYNFDDQISIGDSAFNIDLAAGLATITFDSNDQLYYERSTNSFNFVIAGSGELFLNVNTLTPIVHNGLGLGTPTTSWADLFLATGGVINWENGDVTLTHSSNQLEVTGGNFLAPNLQQQIRISGVNFNSANTDNAVSVVLPTGFRRFRIGGIVISGASATLTTATFGVFTATGGGGTAVIAGGTAITVSSASESTTNNMQFVTPANVNTASYNNTTLYFRVQNAQGSAATADVTIFYQPVS